MSKHPIAERRLVVRAPAMDDVIVDRDISFGGATSPNLRMDVYRPSEETRARLPAVIFVTGYSDVGGRKVLGGNLKDMAAYVDWARLIASSGMIAIAYENEEPIRDIDLLLRYVKDTARPLGIDPARIGIWSCSGNVPNALALLQRRPEELRCAALCYGYMLDTDDRDDVARAAEKWRFVAPTVEMNREGFVDVPMLIVRAGLDDMPGLNASVDRFIAHALRANLPVTVVNQSTGRHAFDVFDATDRSRVAIRQIVGFLKLHLLERSSNVPTDARGAGTW